MLKAVFLKSAVEPKDYPEPNRPEVVLVGRSNAGKSSLLNCMVGSKAIAKVSQKPGKTRLINFFDIGENYRLVDLPGYGFSKRPENEKELWRDMIGYYFDERQNMAGVILVSDIRRQWEREEELVLKMCQRKSIPLHCAITKIDKLSKNELAEQKKRWLKISGLEESHFHFVSNLKALGVRELEDYVFKNWINKK